MRVILASFLGVTLVVAASAATSAEARRGATEADFPQSAVRPARLWTDAERVEHRAYLERRLRADSRPAEETLLEMLSEPNLAGLARFGFRERGVSASTRQKLVDIALQRTRAPGNLRRSAILVLFELAEAGVDLNDPLRALAAAGELPRELRAAAAMYLTDRGVSGVHKLLEDALSGPTADGLAERVYAQAYVQSRLLGMSDADALAWLLGMARSGKWLDAFLAEIGLGLLGELAVPTLIDIFCHAGENSHRGIAFRALSDIGPHFAAGTCIEQVLLDVSEESIVRAMAAGLLGWFGDDAAFAVVERVAASVDANDMHLASAMKWAFKDRKEGRRPMSRNRRLSAKDRD